MKYSNATAQPHRVPTYSAACTIDAVVSEPVNGKSRGKVILEPHDSIGHTPEWIGDRGPIGSPNQLFYRGKATVPVL